MKLNNDGWGLSSFIVFLVLFFVALLILVIVGNVITSSGGRSAIDMIERS